MMFFNKKKVELWLVWVSMVGGDFLKKIYQKEEYTIQKKQALEKRYTNIWIQKIIIKKKKL